MEDENYNYNYNFEEQDEEPIVEEYEDEFEQYEQQEDNNVLGGEGDNVENDYIDEQLYENNGEEKYQVGNRREVWNNYQEMEGSSIGEKKGEYHQEKIIQKAQGQIFFQGNKENNATMFNMGMNNNKELMKFVSENQYDKEKKTKELNNNKNSKKNIGFKIINNVSKIKAKADYYKDIKKYNNTPNNYTYISIPLKPKLSISKIQNTQNSENKSPFNNNMPISFPLNQNNNSKESQKTALFSTKNTDISNYQFLSSYYSKRNQSPSKINQKQNQYLSTNKLSISSFSFVLDKSNANITPKIKLSHPKTPTQIKCNDILNTNKQQQQIHKQISSRNENEKIKNCHTSFNVHLKRNIQTPQYHSNVFIINNLKYYIRCPNCNYLLNAVPLEKNYVNINCSNAKSDRNDRDRKQMIYRKEMEEKKMKEKKEREERELKERKEREERLKKQREEREKKEKFKKEQKEKQMKEYNKKQLEREKEIKRQNEIKKNIDKQKNKKDGQELKRIDFEIYKQNRKEIIMKNKEKDNSKNHRSYNIDLNAATVFKPAIKSPNSGRIVNKLGHSPSYNCNKMTKLILGNNIGIYESHG